MAGQKPPAIVAELGRPETPQETADRKAATSRRHRQNQTALNLVVATIASLAIVLFLVLVVVRPDNQDVRRVDYVAAAAEAEQALERTLVAPALPEGWYANDARYGMDAGVTTWYIGLISPTDGFIAVNQGFDANDTWQAGLLKNTPSTGTAEIEGVTWELFDRRGESDTGNHTFGMAATIGDSRFVLHGTADDADFATVITSILAEVDH